jgi:hypothetical protein
MADIFRGVNMNSRGRRSPATPKARHPQTADELVVRTFAKLDSIALGLSCGIVCGLGLVSATVILLIKGGDQIGPNLSLLGQYFPGYSVTWTGSILGCAYGLAAGFVAGWTLAFVRNFSLTVYAHAVRLQAVLSGNNFLDRFDS